MQKLIRYTFYTLSVLIPLVFTTINSELFEFPKYIILISATILISVAWIHTAIKTKDYSIPRSPLNIPVLAFLISQILSTIFSIHPYTSFWGYYSRFHQGLLTTICYTILYFAFMKFMDKKSVNKFIWTNLITAIIVSFYGILQHFGIDKNLWVQDVQNRVFSTLGQPNWLAAYLIPQLFLALYLQLTSKYSYLYFLPVHFSLITALLFTKSRSGIIALIASLALAYLLIFLKSKTTYIKSLSSTFALSLIVIVLIGTPWTPKLTELLSSPETASFQSPLEEFESSGTQLEIGGSKSSEIRRIVWTGAWELFKLRPFLGTGVETFAYSYYWTRPVDHNYVSEWDFLYNKAHNEYLNLLSTTGALGFITHISFYVFFALYLLNNKSLKLSKSKNATLLSIMIAGSLLSIAITNFFGFSVIPVTLLMYLLPATLFISKEPQEDTPLSPYPLAIAAILIYVFPLRIFIADTYFAKAKSFQQLNQHIQAESYFKKAVNVRPSNPLFHSQYAETLSQITALTATSDNPNIASKSGEYLALTLREIDESKILDDVHLNLYKSRAKSYLVLAQYDSTFNEQAAKEIEEASALAPTDAKLLYNLGLVYSRLARNEDAIRVLEQSIELKKDYIQPYYALTLLYETTKNEDKIPPLLEEARNNLPVIPDELQQKISQYLN